MLQKIITIKQLKIMKTKFFFFAMLASVIASAQVTNVTPISANYANKTVSFRVWWSAGTRDDTHLSKVWVWVDYITVNSNNTTSGNTWTRATVSSASPTAFVSYDGTNRQGFWLQGNSGSYSATVTVQLNITASKFNWCAYVSDYPPNVTLDKGTFTFKGTPNFIVNNPTQIITTKTVTKVNLTVNASTTFTDATGCPGIGSLYCPYTGSDLYMDATHLCQQRTSGAMNWEAYIKDVRDNHIYRIVQMPTNTWWMAEDLMWDGKPNPSATGYTVRGVARDCGTHYGCGRTYNSTATGAGAYAGTANDRRNSDVCPAGWLLPSGSEFTPYATSGANPQPYLNPAEFGGPDTYGLSLFLCGAMGFSCGEDHTAFVCGSCGLYGWYRNSSGSGCRDDDQNGKRVVRCVRDL
jgi:hypothetical protein